MKIALIIIAVIALVPIIGAFLPKANVVSRSAIIRRDPQSIYTFIRDFERAPQWRPDVTRVELLGRTSFREHGKNGVITYHIVRDEPPHLLTNRIANENLGYSGSWTYALEPVPEGTRVTITENGEVSNVIFRFVSRFVFGQTAAIDKTLAALQRQFP